MRNTKSQADLMVKGGEFSGMKHAARLQGETRIDKTAKPMQSFEQNIRKNAGRPRCLARRFDNLHGYQENTL